MTLTGTPPEAAVLAAKRKRKVQFGKTEQDVVREFPRNPRETWYSDDEYREFKRTWKINQVRIEDAQQELGFCFELLGLQDPSDGAHETFAKGAWLSRARLRQVVFKHQDDCRSRGAYDPDGASRLSKSCSDKDQTKALKAAAVNAEAAFQYRKDISAIQPSPTSVSNFPPLDFSSITDPFECGVSFSCVNWDFDVIDGNEILNYTKKFDRHIEQTDTESVSSEGVA
ncbi:unnamed protein product [Cylindrotheca closterium]|uniref:Uncharacterized protein n=1 Tax=Cylindrotheca closterium TaxID=2856 RepID=A0AAD2G1H2_9STRA|nr:unnamed protein product [Cylindrotheca closterium]